MQQALTRLVVVKSKVVHQLLCSLPVSTLADPLSTSDFDQVVTGAAVCSVDACLPQAAVQLKCET